MTYSPRHREDELDPDEALAAMRQALDDWDAAEAGTAEETEAGLRLSSAAGALDDWLSHGGFLPTGWQAIPDTTDACLAVASVLAERVHQLTDRARALWDQKP